MVGNMFPGSRGREGCWHQGGTSSRAWQSLRGPQNPNSGPSPLLTHSLTHSLIQPALPAATEYLTSTSSLNLDSWPEEEGRAFRGLGDRTAPARASGVLLHQLDGVSGTGVQWGKQSQVLWTGRG